jgi:hypothetical protein
MEQNKISYLFNNKNAKINLKKKNNNKQNKLSKQFNVIFFYLFFF